MGVDYPMPETREAFVARITSEWTAIENGSPEELIKSCAYCGTTTDGELIEHEGMTYCQRCFDRRFAPCHFCGALHRRARMMTSRVRHLSENVYVCPDCANSHPQCNECGYLTSQQEYDDNGGYCNICYEDMSECDICGETVHNNHLRTSGGQNYCPSCWSSRAEVIRNYGYKPRPNFLPNSGEPWYYGVEQEHDHRRGYNGDEDDAINSAKELMGISDSQFYIKHDGSLSNGYELVTHPATLDYHLNHFPWDDIAKIAISNDMRAHDTTTAGLHVHASRTRFGETLLEQDLNIAKVMLLFDLFWDKKIVPFSRRRREELDSWANKPSASFERDDNEPTVILKSKRKVSHGERHTAINLMNEKTVEFRVFRGTLKATTIKATLQWLDTLISYAIDTNLRDIWDSDWDNIFAGTEYPELKAYLSDKHLIEGDE